MAKELIDPAFSLSEPRRDDMLESAGLSNTSAWDIRDNSMYSSNRDTLRTIPLGTMAKLSQDPQQWSTVRHDGESALGNDEHESCRGGRPTGTAQARSSYLVTRGNEHWHNGTESPARHKMGLWTISVLITCGFNSPHSCLSSDKRACNVRVRRATTHVPRRCPVDMKWAERADGNFDGRMKNKSATLSRLSQRLPHLLPSTMALAYVWAR